jgi:hypothetical protein
MLGITLMPEQIRTAPVEVRRWIEQEIANPSGCGHMIQVNWNGST